MLCGALIELSTGNDYDSFFLQMDRFAGIAEST
jgi:hypothetical protein